MQIMPLQRGRWLADAGMTGQRYGAMTPERIVTGLLWLAADKTAQPPSWQVESID